MSRFVGRHPAICPVLGLALLAGSAAAGASTGTQDGGRGQARVSAGRDFDEAGHTLVALANVDRARAHLPPLVWDAALARAAQRHAERMAGESAVEHEYPGEPDLLARASAAGAQFSVVSENLLRANPGSAASPGRPGALSVIEQTWMSTPTHRANLLDGRLDQAGIGMVYAGGTLFVVEDFARGSSAPGDASGLRATERAVARELLAHGVPAATPTEAARAACRNPAPPGAATPVLTIAWDGPDPTSLPAALLARLSGASSAEVGACAGSATAQGFATTRVAVLLP